ncbi:PREDICTED: uncharacterized protein LOC109115723 [Nelumbo nucifera]|uniref:Uncharacterized protein LOC109115723 n=1 Tax=Nelumbo nucifera TaxID=4432 RepID=A0A1U8Q9W1_NELNU|nr:PREDICTED: uncharacterized protein LOC109115723 [Nelumbo nucifera]
MLQSASCSKRIHLRVGLDYDEIFSLIVEPTTIRLVLSLVVSFDWELHQLDVNNTFLNGIIHEEVCMKQPTGFVDLPHPDYVCKLSHSSMGLSRPHGPSLHASVTTYSPWDFLSPKLTPLFFLRRGANLVLLLVYVDDILLTRPNPTLIITLVSQLSTQFALKDLDAAHYFLGLELHRCKEGIHVNQHKYIHDLLHQTSLHEAKPIATPMAASTKLDATSGEVLTDPTQFRSVVGALQYVTLTRTNISFSVNKICQFLKNPTFEHWIAAKCILRYLKGTISHSLSFQPTSHSLVAFSDADWANCLVDWHSHSGVCMFLVAMY